MKINIASNSGLGKKELPIMTKKLSKAFAQIKWRLSIWFIHDESLLVVAI
ncbi:hypothetical protein [Chryseobacterium sp. POE27]